MHYRYISRRYIVIVQKLNQANNKITIWESYPTVGGVETGPLMDAGTMLSKE